MPRLPVLGLAAGALAAQLGCQPPTEITLELSTDIACPGSFQGVTVTVASRDAVETNAAGAVTTQCDSVTGRIGSIVVVPSGSRDDEVAIKVVAGRDMSPEDCTADNGYGADAPGAKGCAVARRILRFVPHTPLELPIELRDVCVGVKCAPQDTCVNGICVSAEVTDDERCAEAGACAQPGAPVPRDPVLDVAAGLGASCALTLSGRILCWGDNTVGQFGTGQNATGPQAVTLAMTSLPVPPLAIDVNDTDACALGTDRLVYCAGRNSNGELGSPSAGDGSLDVVRVDGLTDVAQVALSAGGDAAASACARRQNGTVWCWGYAADGRLGDGLTGVHKVDSPGQVGGLGAASDVAISSHGCAVLEDGSVACWGAPDQGALGPGYSDPSGVPLPVAIGATAARVGVGRYESCALRADGGVRCWPYADQGSAQPILDVPTSAGAVAISAGYDFGCATLSSGQVECWGSNAAGILGSGTVDGDFDHPPTAATGVEDAVRISGKEHTVCVVSRIGRVSCWGANESGQATGDGHATVDPVTLPAPIDIPDP